MRDSKENRAIRHKHWTDAFTPGIDVEQTRETPRIDLTYKQKSWIKRAWESFFGYVPNAVPSYSEREGIILQPAKEVHIHHITPVGVANRRDNEDYNYPRNFVPVDASSHVGKGLKEEDDRFILHPDTQIALQGYGKWKKGELDENPFQTMGHDRRIATLHGYDYHDSRLDSFFRALADMVVSAFVHKEPDNKWPEPPVGEGIFTWNPKTKKWE